MESTKRLSLAAPNAPHILSTLPHQFLQPTPSLHASFLELAKSYLDPLANDVTISQDARLKILRGKKRTQKDDGALEHTSLKMRKLHTSGFDATQIWQQSRRILEAAADELSRVLPNRSEASEEDELADGVMNGAEDSESELEEEPGDEDSLDESDGGHSGLGDEDAKWEFDAAENPMLAEDDDEDAVDDFSEQESEDARPSTSKTIVKDKFGLNDGFFSIDEFNKQSQFLEHADARGEDDGAASDEEDIDWTADPMYLAAQPAASSSRSKSTTAPLTQDENDMSSDEDDEDDDDEDGPTFGDMDLDAPEGDSDADGGSDVDGEEGFNGFSNTNEVLYADFFAPPAQPASKKRKNRPKGEVATDLAVESGRDAEDDEMQRTISAVHRDLFDDESEAEEDGDGKTAGAQGNLSSHEKRQLALRAEIRTLEAANVSSKPWTLTGEALAPARPLNSLLEEDLDFERAGKPVPIVTDAVHDDVEALIKRRILARDFDEVVRRRPTDLVTGSMSKRGRVQGFELSDAKPTKSLAEEYAEEHMKQTDANYVDPRSEALKLKHADIEKHWSAISGQLDVLCNWHYKPRPAQAGMEVRVDVPRIAMEEARPSAAGEGAGESILAPQEVYKAGDEGKRNGEIMTRGGLAVAKEEESREQKKRRRRRTKERIRKASGNNDVARPEGNTPGSTNTRTAKGPSRKDVEAQLKKGDVKVIGKGGELVSMDGQKVQAGATRRPSALKL